MIRRSREDARKLIKAIVVLLPNTTWRCGKIERLAVNYLRQKIRRYGYTQTSIKEMLQHFNLSGKKKREFLEAIKRLEKRRIIRIEGF